jgi:hypothetical protein
MNDKTMRALGMVRDLLGALFFVALVYFGLLAGHAFGF